MTHTNNWRPISDKPTEGDADDRGFVYVTNMQLKVMKWHWRDVTPDKSGAKAWHPKQKTPPPYVEPAVKYRDPVLPQDFGVLAEFSTRSDFSDSIFRNLQGFSGGPYASYWMGSNGLARQFCRIPVAPEGEAGPVDAPSAPVPELPEVDWDKIPAGFDWVAVDRNGMIYAFTTPPVTGQSVWWPSYSGAHKGLGVTNWQGDWTQSLMQRPQAKSQAQPIPAVDTSEKRVDAESENGQVRRVPTKSDLKNGPIKAWFWGGCIEKENAIVGDLYQIGDSPFLDANYAQNPELRCRTFWRFCEISDPPIPAERPLGPKRHDLPEHRRMPTKEDIGKMVTVVCENGECIQRKLVAIKYVCEVPCEKQNWDWDEAYIESAPPIPPHDALPSLEGWHKEFNKSVSPTQPESRPANETTDRAEANGLLKLRDNQWMFWAQYGFLTPTEMRTIADELESRDRGQG